MSVAAFVVCAVLVPLSIFNGSAAIVRGGTMASYAAPLDWYFCYQLGSQGVRALEDRHALQGNQFLKLRERPTEIDPVLFARMRRVAAMAELKGIGIENALALERLGIKRIEDLARRDPDELASKLKAMDQNVRLEEVKIWIRAAKRYD